MCAIMGVEVMRKSYEIRCPIHGFIQFDDWEREIIAHPAFQRLRRIRQLGWTDYVYPGAMHTRFEHSLGVMHTASRLLDAVLASSGDLLKDEFGYVTFDRHRRVVRLAALLHDVGHGPFSHAAEELLPARASGDKFKHESYSAAIVRESMKDVIEGHRINQANFNIKADEIAALLENSTRAKELVFWRDLIDSQLDADRMDYLLRDSYHLGVAYGRYDLDRIVNTVCAIRGADDEAPRVGFKEGGWHAAESLVLARYYMFTQVYFHKTRVAYDHHIVGAMKALLPDGVFPEPKGDGLKEFLEWDDWRVLGLLSSGEGGDHGRRLRERDHYRMVYHTVEHPVMDDLEHLKKAKDALAEACRLSPTSSKSWYSPTKSEINVEMDDGRSFRPLSVLSLPVANIGGHDQTLLYVDKGNVETARQRIEEITP